MLVLDRAAVTTLLTPRACLEAMESVMIALVEGRATLPPRTVLPLPGGAAALFMPAALATPALLGAKVVTIFPGNDRRGLPSHQAGLLVFEGRHGRPQALLEGASLTAIRTAAVTALATRLLSRPDSRVLALLGTGVQARSHLTALTAVREFAEVRVWSPRPESRRTFVEAVRAHTSPRVTAVDSAEEAVRSADVVTTVTAARRPIIEAEWIAPGTHVNAVGASTATTRELPTALVRAAALFVDHRAAALEEAGELLVPIGEGALTERHIRAELGEVAAGRHPGRSGGREVTVFKSVGLAVQDLAAAALVIAEAERRGLGPTIDWS